MTTRRVALLCVGIPVAIFIVSQWLTNFTSALNGFAAGPVSWDLLVAVLQFPIAMAAGVVYIRVADRGAGTGAGTSARVAEEARR
jgi:uncharacterized membrane protein (DUF485 family)